MSFPLETWLTKLKSSLLSLTSVLNQKPYSNMHPSKKTNTIGILAFEIATLMYKLTHLWRSLSDTQLSQLKYHTITFQGMRKLVSDDDDFLLSLARAEFTETLLAVAESTSNLATNRCIDNELRQFVHSFKKYKESDEDVNRWVMSWKEMDAKAKKMDRYCSSTATLYKEMDELADAEQGLKKLLRKKQSFKINGSSSSSTDLQQNIFWQRQEIKYLQQSSIWGCSFDTAVSLLARSCFTVLARIRHVFGHNCSLTAAPESTLTLGEAAMALHYASIIHIIEKMSRSPRMLTVEARDELYGMLPASVRGLLRRRLKGVVGFGLARDEALAREWREAVERILEWLGPLASKTMRWQSERSFEKRRINNNGVGLRVMSLLKLETLYFADREKVEAAVAEMLVGLNYLWRFEMDMINV